MSLSRVKRWAGFRAWKSRVSEAEVDLAWPVPGEVVVRADGVELDAQGFCFADQVEGVVELFAVQPLVLQRLEGPLPHAVLSR